MRLAMSAARGGTLYAGVPRGVPPAREEVYNSRNLRSTMNRPPLHDHPSRGQSTLGCRSGLVISAPVHGDGTSSLNIESYRTHTKVVAKVVPLVQVVLDYMGVEKQMNVRKNTSKADFLSQAKTFLGSSHNLDATPLGLDAWEIRESGFRSSHKRS
jgi:hypothetical protein